MVDAGFGLHPQLAADCHQVCRVGGILVLLLDDARYPWLVLVPAHEGVAEWMDLPKDAQADLHQLTMTCSAILQELFDLDKINIGALGNLVPQLHVHVVARYKNDPAWPGPVWGHSPATPYAPDELKQRMSKLQAALQ
ncbi:MAG: HIT family protein [Parvibaculales bacterium]